MSVPCIESVQHPGKTQQRDDSLTLKAGCKGSRALTLKFLPKTLACPSGSCLQSCQRAKVFEHRRCQSLSEWTMVHFTKSTEIEGKIKNETTGSLLSFHDFEDWLVKNHKIHNYKIIVTKHKTINIFLYDFFWTRAGKCGYIFPDLKYKLGRLCCEIVLSLTSHLN